MKKQILFTMALAGCSLMAQAGVVKDSYSALCSQTGSAPMDIPADQLDGKATEADVSNGQLVMVSDSVKDKALSLIDGWDTANMVLNVDEGDDNVSMYMAPIEGTDRNECVIVIKQQDEPQLMLIYLEGNNKLLDAVNIN